jgi:mono/diheme cytochrome c family protein
MRHALTTRYVVIATIVLVVASGLFALFANIGGPGTEDRTEVILGLEPRVEEGRDIYTDVTRPACASCHSLADAGVDTSGGPSLDDLAPDAEATIRSIVGGTVPAHDDEDYEHSLSNQQIADLAAYVEQVAGG